MKHKRIKSTALLLAIGFVIPSGIGGMSTVSADAGKNYSKNYKNWHQNPTTNISTSITMPVSYQTYKNKMVVNGRYDDGVYNYNQNWYLSMDDLAEKLGGYAYYNRYTGIGTFYWNGKTITLTNQTNTVSVNGENITLSAAAVLLDDGRLDRGYDADDLYIPMDFVEKVLGGTATVQTQGQASLIVIQVGATPSIPGQTNPNLTNPYPGQTNPTPINPGNVNASTSSINGTNIYNALAGQNGWRKLSSFEGEYQPFGIKDEIISYEIKRKYGAPYLEIEVENTQGYLNYNGKDNLALLLNAVDTTLGAQLLEIADTALKTGTSPQIGQKISSGSFDAYLYAKQTRKGTEIKIYIGVQGFSLYR